MHLSLQKPSLLWLSAGSNSFECAKSLVIGRMVSGRYRSDYLCRHWTPSNREGFCLADTCQGVEGDLVHMLTICPALQSTRDRLVRFWKQKTQHYPVLSKLLSEVLSSPPHAQTQFILDPCLVPAILALCNKHGKELFDHVYYITRTFAYYMHRAKMISLGRWPGDPGRKPKPVTHQKIKPRNLKLNKPCHDRIPSFAVAGTIDPDQPTSALSHSSLTIMSTVTHGHTTLATPLTGLVTYVGYQQQTAGHCDLGHVVVGDPV